jgi:hypothetical protein
MFPSLLEFSFMKLFFYEEEIVRVKLRVRGYLNMKTKKKPETRDNKIKEMPTTCLNWCWVVLKFYEPVVPNKHT